MKRRFEEIAEVGHGDDFQFQFLDGSPVPGKAMFTTFTQQLILIIVRGFTAERLRLLEQTSKMARDWVRKHNLWMQLFARDFPDAFTIHFDQKNREMAQMSAYAATQLQIMSPQGRGPRVYTLWKRYYELMSKAPPTESDIIRARSALLSNPSQLPHPVYPDIPRTTTYLYLPAPAPGDLTLGYWVPTYGTLEMLTNPNLLPELRQVARESGKRINDVLLETSYMEKISFEQRVNSRLLLETVPYDRTKLGRIVINANNWDWSRFRSNDGFFTISYKSRDSTVAVFRTSATLTRTLVSSNCYVCGSVESRLCLGCEQVSYCGTACQAKDWKLGHAKKCNF
jgi:hypothetical protein